MSSGATQQRWVSELRAFPRLVRVALDDADDAALRRRPAEGEWSAVEVVGHLIDKMGVWTSRVERVATEDRPFLASFDQDALVRERAYQWSDPTRLLEDLEAACQRFAELIERLAEAALERQGVHEENGPMTLRQCVQAPLGSIEGHLAQLREALSSS